MKTKKGGGLPDVLIPLGLIVAREYGPKLVRSLKRRLTKKGGRKRRRTVRKRKRTRKATRKGKRSRKTLRGGNFGSCSRCHVGGSKSEQKEANKVTAKKIAQQAMKESKQLPAAVKAKISLASKKAARTIPLKKNINSTPLDKLIEDMETFSKEMKTNILQEKSQLPKDQQTPGGQQVKKIVDKYISELNRKSMLVKQASDKLGGKRKTKSLLPCCIPCPPHAPDTDACLLPCQRCVPLKTKRKRTKGKRTKGKRTKGKRTKGKRTKGKRTKGKRTKGKQKGGFMRGATRNFCTMKH